MKYYLIAGEASGDLYGATLMKALKIKDPNAVFRFWGGNEMLKQDKNIVMHYRETAFMGFIEVLKNLPKIFQFLKKCKTDILAFKPDVVILIDYPGFNLRIAKWARKNDFKIAYYVAPQVWAWKAGRIKQMKANIDSLYVILPFEKTYFESRGMPTEYFGHPLIEIIENHKSQFTNQSTLPEGCIACLPGSRKQEIKSHLQYIIEMAKAFPDESFVIAANNAVPSKSYETNESLENLSIITDRTYELMSQCKVAIIASGTATLEACLFKVPQLVIYKGNPISFQIAKRIVNVKYISLVNLIASKKVVEELIQSDLNIDQLKKSLEELMQEKGITRQLESYKSIRNSLGNGQCSDLIADDIYNAFKVN